jgi:hemolysin III
MQYGERLNTFTHLGGALLAFGASIPLLARALEAYGQPGLVSTAVYAVSLVLMYGCSSAYHAASGALKDLLRRFDHLSIYLLIAGSYTPFCMLMLSGREGWILLGVVWSLALVGIVQETRPRAGARVLSMLVYLAMGWSARP